MSSSFGGEVALAPILSASANRALTCSDPQELCRTAKEFVNAPERRVRGAPEDAFLPPSQRGRLRHSRSTTLWRVFLGAWDPSNCGRPRLDPSLADRFDAFPVL